MKEKVSSCFTSSGNVLMGDIHLSNFAHHLSNGHFNVHDHHLTAHKTRNRGRQIFNLFTLIRSMTPSPGHLDVAVVEATEITEDGGIVPGGSFDI